MKRKNIARKKRKQRSILFRRIVLVRKIKKRWRREFCEKKKKKKRNKKSRSAEEKEAERLKRFFSGYDFIKAPQILSLIDNEEETLDFIRKIKEKYLERKKLCVRLDKVREMTTDAVLVLLSNMVQFKLAGIDFNGTKPDNSILKYKLESSGFFKRLYGNTMQGNDEFSFSEMGNHLYTHGQKTVVSKLADSIVEYTSKFVWGESRRCQGVQLTLLELMHNTYDHADPQKGGKHWWLSVEKDNYTKEVTFSFIDFGVGIFRSLENKAPDEPLYGSLGELTRKFPWANTEDKKLKLILEGKIKKNQENKYYRGKGLANIYTRYKENKIGSLTIISNYASCNVDRQDFHQLDKEFEGTFISFKISNQTISLPWTI